jgi:hypothetical protein
MGRAMSRFGAGVLVVGQEGHNYFIGSRIVPMGDKDGIQVLQFVGDDDAVDDGALPETYREPVPLSAQSKPIYLTVAVVEDYEFVVLEFE